MLFDQEPSIGDRIEISAENKSVQNQFKITHIKMSKDKERYVVESIDNNKKAIIRRISDKNPRIWYNISNKGVIDTEWSEKIKNTKILQNED